MLPLPNTIGEKPITQPSMLEIYFDDGSCVHWLHKHEYKLEIHYIEHGAGSFIIGNSWYTVKSGDIIICDRNTLHGDLYQKDCGLQSYCLGLTGVQILGMPENCLLQPGQLPVLRPDKLTADTIRQLMLMLYALRNEKRKREHLCHSLSESIVLLTIKQLQSSTAENSSVKTSKSDLVVQQIIDYLERHYREKVMLSDIAQRLNISASHISHAFRQFIGVPPMQYITLRRVGEAQSLLAETDIPIAVVVERLGFDSNSHLNQVFKRYVGMSPTEYRQRFRR